MTQIITEKNAIERTIEFRKLGFSITKPTFELFRNLKTTPCVVGKN
jgi:hypothetical protein